MWGWWRRPKKLVEMVDREVLSARSLLHEAADLVLEMRATTDQLEEVLAEMTEEEEKQGEGPCGS